MDFNVTDYEIFIDMVSDCASQLTFLNLPLVECCCKSENVHNCLKRLLNYSCLF